MKVLYFHQYFSTPEGTGGSRSYKFAKKLVERGHEVTMVCSGFKGGGTGLSGPFVRGRRSGQVDGIHVIQLELPYSNYLSLPRRALTFFRFALRSVAIALSKDYDLLFATSTPLTAGIPGIFGSVLRRKPFIFEVRDLWPELPRAMGVVTNPLILWAMSLLEWLCYHTATHCVGLSPGIVDGIHRRGIDKNRITMIPNGCDLDIFTSERGLPKFADCFGANDFLAIFAGAHGLANGLDAVLDAAKVLVERGNKEIKFLFVGDGSCKPGLVARATEENLCNCIFWDSIPKNDLAELFTHVHLGLMILDNVPAFYYGTSPNKFFDYISSGLPVLNNYPGWLADMIKEHRCGVVVAPGDPVAFADALEALSVDRAQCATMGHNARMLSEAKFARETLSAQFVDCLEVVHQVVLKTGGRTKLSSAAKQADDRA